MGMPAGEPSELEREVQRLENSLRHLEHSQGMHALHTRALPDVARDISEGLLTPLH
jgi:hypothetical protein